MAENHNATLRKWLRRIGRVLYGDFARSIDVRFDGVESALRELDYRLQAVHKLQMDGLEAASDVEVVRGRVIERLTDDMVSLREAVRRLEERGG